MTLRARPSAWRRIAAAALLTLVAATTARAAETVIPLQVSTQGRLLDGQDSPVTASLPMTFAIYPVADNQAGQPPVAALWQATYQVRVSNGLYAVVLGDPAIPGQPPLPATLFDGSGPRYMGVTVGTDSEARPRFQFTSAPYTLLAAKALVADRLGTKTQADFDDAIALKADLTAVALKADSAALAAPGTLNADGNPVHWTQLKGVPDGLADGDDGLTTIAVGAPLTGNGTIASPITIGAGSIGSSLLAGDLDGAKFAAGSIPATALAAIPAAKVTGLSTLQATCPDGKVLAGYDTTFTPVCTSVAPGVGAILQWSSGGLDFGVTSTANVTRTATLVNVGAGPAEGIQVAATSGFSATTACTTLEPRATCAVTFTFLASGVGGGRTGVGTATSTTSPGAAPVFLTGFLSAPGGSGADAQSAGLNCSAIKAAFPSFGDGVYWIDADGSGPAVPFQTTCDMSGGGWTLIASTKLPLQDTQWVTGAPYADLRTLHPTGTFSMLVNTIPFGSISDFRFTCYTSNSATSYGLDWQFPLQAASNQAVLADLYDDAKLSGTRGNMKLVQSTGVTRLTGYDAATHRSDWGLGSSGTDSEWWLHEAWGQVDTQGGHCQDPGVQYTTNTLGGTGQFHIWVRNVPPPTSTGSGLDPANFGASCKSIKSAFANSADGLYWIDADGGGPIPSTRIYCDMANGGWTLVASTKIPTTQDTVWHVGSSYDELQTKVPTNSNTVIYNKIPFSTLSDFRFTCYTSASASSYGVDWTFNLNTGGNRSLLTDIYDDAIIGVYGGGKLTQSNGTVRLIGYDNSTSKADWGLGSEGTDSVYWAHEAWGQVDAQGGHCQQAGLSHATSTLGGAGIYHIWVR